jgi:hypothetical protein
MSKDMTLKLKNKSIPAWIGMPANQRDNEVQTPVRRVPEETTDGR